MADIDTNGTEGGERERERERERMDRFQLPRRNIFFSIQPPPLPHFYYRH